MASPVGSSNQGDGIQQLKAQIIGWIRDEIRKAQMSGTNGLHVDGATGSLIIDKGNTRSGNYVAGSTGWALDNAGNAEFNVLTLRGGIIGDAALANPVSFGQSNAGAGSFAVPVAATAIATTTIPVPAGYSRALVHATTAMTVWSTSTGTAAVYLQAGINAVTLVNASSAALDPAHGFNWAPLAASASKTLTGLSGGNITINACAGSLTALPANASNSVNLDVIAIFLR